MPHDATFFGLMRASLLSPGQTASWLLGLSLPRATLLEATALLAVVGGIVAGYPGGVLLPTPDGQEVVVGPLVWSLVLGAGIILSASSLQVAGRILGGRGRFEDALLVTVWLNALGLAVELVAIVLSLFSTNLATLVFVVGFLFLIWPLLHFVRVLHGFDGLGRSFLAVLLGGLGTTVGFSFILAFALSFGVPLNV
jgi:hypothetical protein